MHSYNPDTTALILKFMLYIGFGLACHLGVLSDIPCVGVGKKLHLVDGLQNDLEHKSKVCHIFMYNLMCKIMCSLFRYIVCSRRKETTLN